MLTYFPTNRLINPRAVDLVEQKGETVYVHLSSGKTVQVIPVCKPGVSPLNTVREWLEGAARDEE